MNTVVQNISSSVVQNVSSSFKMFHDQFQYKIFFDNITVIKV